MEDHAHVQHEVGGGDGLEVVLEQASVGLLDLVAVGDALAQPICESWNRLDEGLSVDRNHPVADLDGSHRVGREPVDDRNGPEPRLEKRRTEHVVGIDECVE